MKPFIIILIYIFAIFITPITFNYSFAETAKTETVSNSNNKVTKTLSEKEYKDLISLKKDYETYKPILAIWKKVQDYFNLIITGFVSLIGIISFLWINLSSSLKTKLESNKKEFLEKTKEVDYLIEKSKMLSEIELFNIQCKNFLILNNWDGKTTINLDFNPVIQAHSKSLIKDYKNILTKFNSLKNKLELEDYFLADNYTAIGDAYYQTKEFDKAIEIYKKGLDYNLFSSQLNYNLWFSYLEQRIHNGKKEIDFSIERGYFLKAIEYGEFEYKVYIWLVLSYLSGKEDLTDKEIEIVKDSLKKAYNLDKNLSKNLLKQNELKIYIKNIKFPS